MDICHLAARGYEMPTTVLRAWPQTHCGRRAAASVLCEGTCLATVLYCTMTIDSVPKLVCVSRAFYWMLHSSALLSSVSLESICSSVHRCGCGTLCVRQFTSLLAPLASCYVVAMRPLLLPRLPGCPRQIFCPPEWNVDERLGVAVVSFGRVYGSVLSFDLSMPVLPAAARVLLVLSDDGQWTNTLTSVLSLPDGLGALVVSVQSDVGGSLW